MNITSICARLGHQAAWFEPEFLCDEIFCSPIQHLLRFILVGASFVVTLFIDRQTSCLFHSRNCSCHWRLWPCSKYFFVYFSNDWKHQKSIEWRFEWRSNRDFRLINSKNTFKIYYSFLCFGKKHCSHIWVFRLDLVKRHTDFYPILIHDKVL